VVDLVDEEDLFGEIDLRGNEFLRALVTVV